MTNTRALTIGTLVGLFLTGPGTYLALNRATIGPIEPAAAAMTQTVCGFGGIDPMTLPLSEMLASQFGSVIVQGHANFLQRIVYCSQMAFQEVSYK